MTTIARDTGRAPGTLWGGAALLGVASLVANAGNYLMNLLLGRWLSPAGFADATLMVTLWLTTSAVAMGLQLVTARFVGIDPQGLGTQRLVQRLSRWGWLLGLGLALVLALAAPALQTLFHTGSRWPFVVLAVGLPFYLSLATGRGVLQGRLGFRRLSLSYLVEMGVRVSVGTTLVLLGLGVVGATAGLTASFVITWLLVRLDHVTLAGDPVVPSGVRRYLASVGVLLVGQVILTHSDVLVAKAFLSPDDAGGYAAVALVGRGVFFVSWAAATVIFPSVARRHAHGEETRHLLRGGVLAVAGLGLVCTLGALLVGDVLLGGVLGPQYAHLDHALARYALATTVFAVANLIASHHLSTGRVRESWLIVLGAVGQTVLLLVRHHSIDELVDAQLVAMAVLLLAVVASHFSSAPPSRVQERLTPP